MTPESYGRIVQELTRAKSASTRVPLTRTVSVDLRVDDLVELVDQVTAIGPTPHRPLSTLTEAQAEAKAIRTDLL